VSDGPGPLWKKLPRTAESDARFREWEAKANAILDAAEPMPVAEMRSGWRDAPMTPAAQLIVTPCPACGAAFYYGRDEAGTEKPCSCGRSSFNAPPSGFEPQPIGTVRSAGRWQMWDEGFRLLLGDA
jgi:hypothetical protein